MSLHEKLNAIQCGLVATKDACVSYGKTNYAYRSCESILEALKPLLKQHQVVITLSDKIEQVGDRIYVASTATLSDGDGSVSTTAMAREPINKSGMDESQVTGGTSSYARKYALCGLFAIDDNKDADALHEGMLQQEQQSQRAQIVQPVKKSEYASKDQVDYLTAYNSQNANCAAYINNCLAQAMAGSISEFSVQQAQSIIDSIEEARNKKVKQ